MKITVIHGQSHRGSSYHITQQILDKISNTNKEIFEYFMPNEIHRAFVLVVINVL